MTDIPFTYDELDEMFRGDGHNDFVGLSSIDGMIAALVTGPGVVPRKKWLPLIFANKMPSAVEGSPESRATATIMARYAEVEQTLATQPLAYQPILIHHLGRFIVRPWAIGFMLGLGQLAEAWMPVLTGSLRKDIVPILASSEVGRPLLFELSDREVERIAADTEVNQIARAVVAVNGFHATNRRPQILETQRRPAKRRR